MRGVTNARGCKVREVRGSERKFFLRGYSIGYEVHLVLILIVSLCVRSTPF